MGNPSWCPQELGGQKPCYFSAIEEGSLDGSIVFYQGTFKPPLGSWRHQAIDHINEGGTGVWTLLCSDLSSPCPGWFTFQIHSTMNCRANGLNRCFTEALFEMLGSSDNAHPALNGWKAEMANITVGTCGPNGQPPGCWGPWTQTGTALEAAGAYTFCTHTESTYFKARKAGTAC